MRAENLYSFLLLCAMLLGIPALTLVLLPQVEPYSPPERVDYSPIYGSVQLSKPQEIFEATIEVTPKPAQEVAYASSIGGTVTSIATGDQAEPWDPVITVDDRQVFANLSPTPLYRDVGLGDQGRDVAVVQQFLAAIGIANRQELGDASVGPATQAAITRFNREYGWSDNNPSDGEFPRDALMFFSQSDGSSRLRVQWESSALGKDASTGLNIATVRAEGDAEVRVVLPDEIHDLPFLYDLTFNSVDGVDTPLTSAETVPRSAVEEIVRNAVDQGMSSPDNESNNTPSTSGESVSGTVTATGREEHPSAPLSAIVMDTDSECVLTPSLSAIPVEILWADASVAFLRSNIAGQILLNANEAPDVSCG